MLVAAKLKAEKIEARNFPFNKELKCTCFDNVCCCCYYMFRLFFRSLSSFRYVFFPRLSRSPLSIALQQQMSAHSNAFSACAHSN